MTALGRFAGVVLTCVLATTSAAADEIAIESFDSTGRLTFNTLADGTNYNYRVEWAPHPAGPWNVFGASGACRLDTIQAPEGSNVTSSVPMCYRVVATLGDYMCIDISGGTNATRLGGSGTVLVQRGIFGKPRRRYRRRYGNSGLVSAECVGFVRHARQRVGMVLGLV